MATITSNGLKLEFIVTEWCEYDPAEFHFKITMTWNGIPLLNDKAMKRHNSYWRKGYAGGIIGYEIDYLRIVDTIENALRTGEMQFWESFPDPDVYISIYPHRSFPNLDEPDTEHFAFIVSPDSYQFKGADCYEGYEGISLVMNPTEADLRKFLADLKAEQLAKIKGKIETIIAHCEESAIPDSKIDFTDCPEITDFSGFSPRKRL